MSKSLYLMSTTTGPAITDGGPTSIVPKYYQNIPEYAAFYLDGNLNVLLACEDNPTLNAASDVFKILPSGLDVAPNAITSTKFKAYIGPNAVGLSGTYRQILQKVAGSPIALGLGDGFVI
jgi:hypothetical protein